MVQGEEISLPGKLCEKVNSNLLLNCNNVNKYEIYILSDILNYKISVLNQYDEKIFEYNTNSSNVITIKYDLYNDIINKYYVIYTIK
jgi:hypothetical protein